MAAEDPRYTGRFAPSPTGPLHLGSLVAAVASYADALACNGHWLVRMEDVDQTRAIPGMDRQILRTLERLGFRWEGPVLYQSTRTDRYLSCIDDLRRRELAYDCGCSRSEVAAKATTGIEGPIYPGTCREGLGPNREPRSIRLKVADRDMICEDRIAPSLRQNPARDLGDFVIRRADGYVAYQLAVVVDDADQGITDVVRGADLYLSTPRQVYLQQLLNMPTPRYAHVPLVRGADGAKLSKQDKARPVDPESPMDALRRAWRFLGQTSPPPDLTVDDFWRWAGEAWRIDHVPPPLEPA